MLCDGWLGIVGVVSMSLSKHINSSFARQEGSDIEAIKKTLKPVLAECPQKNPSQNTETWFVYMWRISFPFPPHRAVHYVSACPGWFCAGFILYPNTSLVPTNQDSIWEYFYWCTGTKSHHPTWDVNAIRGIHGFPLDLHSWSKGWAWLRRYSRFISDGNHHARQEWNYLHVGEGRSHPQILTEHTPTHEMWTLQLILLKKEAMGKVESFFSYGSAYRRGLHCDWECCVCLLWTGATSHKVFCQANS